MPSRGVARAGDDSLSETDLHMSGPVPIKSTVVGAVQTSSASTFVNNRGVVRKNDTGLHGSCMGSNSFKVLDGSKSFFVDGKPVSREGDPTYHCNSPIVGAGMGKIQSPVSTNVYAGDEIGLPTGREGMGLVAQPISTEQPPDSDRVPYKALGELYREDFGWDYRTPETWIQRQDAVTAARKLHASVPAPVLLSRAETLGILADLWAVQSTMKYGQCFAPRTDKQSVLKSPYLRPVRYFDWTKLKFVTAPPQFSPSMTGRSRQTAVRVNGLLQGAGLAFRLTTESDVVVAAFDDAEGMAYLREFVLAFNPHRIELNFLGRGSDVDQILLHELVHLSTSTGVTGRLIANMGSDAAFRLSGVPELVGSRLNDPESGRSRFECLTGYAGFALQMWLFGQDVKTEAELSNYLGYFSVGPPGPPVEFYGPPWRDLLFRLLVMDYSQADALRQELVDLAGVSWLDGVLDRFRADYLAYTGLVLTANNRRLVTMRTQTLSGRKVYLYAQDSWVMGSDGKIRFQEAGQTGLSGENPPSLALARDEYELIVLG